MIRKFTALAFGLPAAAISIQWLDQPVSAWFQARSDSSMATLARNVTDVALGEYWFGLALFVYLFARFWPHHPTRHHQRHAADRMRRWALHLFVALLGSGVFLHVLKWLFGRQRPHRSEIMDPHVFHPFNLDWHFQSLPSGHTQVLFTVATSAALLWPRGSWILYGTAAVLAFTRVITLQHFVSDVVAGALVGYLATTVIHHWFKRKVPWPHLPVAHPESHSAAPTRATDDSADGRRAE